MVKTNLESGRFTGYVRSSLPNIRARASDPRFGRYSFPNAKWPPWRSEKYSCITEQKNQQFSYLLGDANVGLDQAEAMDAYRPDAVFARLFSYRDKQTF